MQLPRLYTIAHNAVTIEFSQHISVDVHQKVMALYRALEQKPFKEYSESVPAYSSLTVYTSTSLPVEKCKKLIQPYLEGISNIKNEFVGKLHAVPVCYDPSLGFDLNWVCSTLGLSADELIRLHSSVAYDVFMIGFVPGFPYLGILPKELELPRKEKPTLRIPAGSVAIAGKQTGIYPAVIPGGWHVIGRTPLQFFDPKQNPCCPIEPGDRIQFEPITLESFNSFA